MSTAIVGHVVKNKVDHACKAHHVSIECGLLNVFVEQGVLFTNARGVKIEVDATQTGDKLREGRCRFGIGDIDTLCKHPFGS